MDIGAFLTTATSAVGLFDKVVDEVQRFIRKEKPELGSVPHRMTIERDGDSLIGKENGVVVQRISGVDLEKLPPEVWKHIQILERSMQNYYQIWSATYPQLALLSDPLQKAKVELALRQELLAMKKDLENILQFLEQCGFWLDDHYLGIRDALRDFV